MKKILSIVLALTILLSIAIPVSVGAVGYVSNLKQIKATKNSITIQWSPASDATSYNIYKIHNYSGEEKIGSTTSTSYTVTGLSNTSDLEFTSLRVVPVSSSGEEGYSSSDIYRSSLRLVPAKGSAKISYFWSTSSSVTFAYPELKYQDGYQFKVYKANKNKAVKTITNSRDVKLKKGQFYKVKTRSYVLVNSKKLYGAWSSFKYFTVGLKSLKSTSRTTHSVKIKWAKVKGGKVKYDIYVSKNYNKGKKKTLKNVKGTSARVSKIGKKSLKKGAYYYFYVVPKIKVGKKYKSSPIMGYLWTRTNY